MTIDPMDDDEFLPRTSPAGDLIKPPRKPPTAVGLAMLPSPEGGRPRVRRASRRSWFSKFLSNTFDLIDALGDAVAETLKLRPL